MKVVTNFDGAVPIMVRTAGVTVKAGFVTAGEES